MCYEDLCLQPQTWMRLAELADIPATEQVGDAFRLSEPQRRWRFRSHARGSRGGNSRATGRTSACGAGLNSLRDGAALA